MRKNVVINSITYNSVPQIEIPLSGGGGNAVFYDTTTADAGTGDVLSGKTYYKDGLKTGAMTNNGAVSGTISTKAGTYTVPAGYHNGAGSVAISSTEQAKIITGNIKSGVTILGVRGKSSVVDTSDADATAAQILSGQTAYVNGTKLTGSMTRRSVSQDGVTKVLTIA
jgi:hypothetical protein